jgi:uncharacterized protein involved in exopolysaccharide biosynthesis
MKSYLETGFRNPLLFLIPALAVPVLVFGGLRLKGDSFEVKATLWVEEPQPDSATTVSPTSLTPARREVMAFEERLDSEAVRLRILEGAKLLERVDALQWPLHREAPGWLTSLPAVGAVIDKAFGAAPATAAEARMAALDYVRSSVAVKEKGRNLLEVTYSGSDPEGGAALVSAAIAINATEKAALAQKQAEESVRFFNDQVVVLEQGHAQAREALLAYKATLPFGGTPQTAIQVERVQELVREQEAARTRLEEARKARDAAYVQSLTEQSRRANNLRMLDRPVPPTSPVGGLKRTVMLTLAAGVFGAALGAGFIVLRTWATRSVRRPEELEMRLALPVIAAVPLLGDGKRRTTWR